MARTSGIQLGRTQSFQPFDWECPHCNRGTTITENNLHQQVIGFNLPNKHGPKVLLVNFYTCPSQSCKEFSLQLHLYNLKIVHYEGGSYTSTNDELSYGNHLKSWKLIPPSDAITFPDFVPEQIRDNYQEACIIRDLSPKASATMSRRAIQGILRDFYEAKGPTLKAEINSVKDKMEEAVIEAIDAARKIGNIGAHMEKDVNLIIDIDPSEAQILIDLTETLIEETYIHREKRKARLARPKELGAVKQGQKNSEKPK